MNGQRSSTEEVICTIPQGSCIGPLLFIAYHNDFESCKEFSKANMHADDTHTTVAYKSLWNMFQLPKVNLNFPRKDFNMLVLGPGMIYQFT